MADNRRESNKNQTCWILRDSMVEDLIEAPKTAQESAMSVLAIIPWCSPTENYP